MARASTLVMELAEALFRRQTWQTRSEIASEVGRSQGTVSPWIDYLEFFHALRNTPEGLQVDQRQLLSTLTSYRVANLRPEKPVTLYGDTDAVHERLVDAEIPHSFAMFSAANQWAFFERHRHVHVYVGRGTRREVLEATDGLLDERSGPAGQLQLYTENLDTLSTQDREGIPVTSPLQTTIDLRAHPEGGAHAEFLEENLLPRISEEAP